MTTLVTNRSRVMPRSGIARQRWILADPWRVIRSCQVRAEGRVTSSAGAWGFAARMDHRSTRSREARGITPPVRRLAVKSARPRLARGMTLPTMLTYDNFSDRP
ncbi:hypothetical protein [Roseateles amylovorans]|uniref:Uncharacterized protein n=1 Tax=Roseateles amylovorans TaxID=2978473 RepID=A0ABY6B4V9_9BURK|nr:hypothetical protein [Roseateles amylovorans]UXH79969.1 hypothetical protein N4261_08850 [Roseateles amylovorans]